MRLYEISSQFMHIMDMAEMGDLDEQTIADTLEAIDAEFDEKAKAVLIVKKQLEAQSQAFKDQIDRMTKLKKSCDKQAEDLEEYLRQNMAVTGKDKLNLGLFSVTLKAPTKVLDIVDDAKLPRKYWLTKTEEVIDKKMLLDDIKAGAEIDGAQLKDSKRALLVK